MTNPSTVTRVPLDAAFLVPSTVRVCGPAVSPLIERPVAPHSVVERYRSTVTGVPPSTRTDARPKDGPRAVTQSTPEPVKLNTAVAPLVPVLR